MKTQSNKQLSGVFTALVTPFTAKGNVDYAAFTKLIDRQLEAGIDGLVVCGSTGEAMTVADDERFQLVSHCVKQVQGRVPVLAGAGSNDTKIACELHVKMQALGADATLQVMPWYNKPTQEGLYLHFRQVAKSCDLPFILYNIPSRTGCDIAPKTVLRLAQDFPQIVGLKESNVETVRLQSLIDQIQSFRSDFSFFSGEDGFVLPLLAMGGQGVISVFANLAPKPACDMLNAFKNNELKLAQEIAGRLTKLISLMFFRSNPIPVKSALYLSGLIENQFRLPLCPLNTEDMAYFKAELKKGDWL